MKTLGYYNGRYGELHEMQIPMLDRACYFGDGVYDATYSRNHKIFALGEHIDRFYRSAEALGICIGETKEELADILSQMVKKVDDGEQFVYFQATRGTGLRDHAATFSRANLWIMLKSGVIRDTYAPMRCISGEDTRFFHCNVKSLNLLPNVLATQAATAAGMDECILHRGNVVTECAHSNLSILKNGVLITHPANEMIYAGTGRAHLMAECKRQDIPVEERTYTVEELWQADEVLVTSASALCVPVIELDGRPIGGKAPHTVRSLQDALLKDYLQATE